MHDEPYIEDGTHGRKYSKKQSLYSSVLCLAVTCGVFLLPDFPFDRRIAYFTLFAAAIYAGVYVFHDRMGGYYHRVITAISVLGLVVISCIVHLTGGIVSPLICFYFGILISEAAYGVDHSVSIVAAVVCFVGGITAEATGLLTASQGAAAVYASPLTAFMLVVTVASLMAITGNIGRIIIQQLKREVEEENREKHIVMHRFSELEAHSQIGLLAHRIVHDLRGPISSISGYLQIEGLKDKPAKEKEMLKDLNDVVMGMSESLSNITRFGKASSNPAEKIPLADFIRNLIAITSFSPQAKGVRFVKLYPDTSPICVSASRQDLQQVYFNLIKNAVEAMRNNSTGKVLEIGITKDGKDVVVTVADNGPGMPEEILKTLFRKSITTKKDGTGVGLLIAKDLLTKNNGDIELHNRKEGGVCVITRLTAV